MILLDTSVIVAWLDPELVSVGSFALIPNPAQRKLNRRNEGNEEGQRIFRFRSSLPLFASVRYLFMPNRAGEL